MTSSNAKDHSSKIIYGSFNDFETVFLPIDIAQHYAKLHTLHNKGITFGELFEKLPDFFYQILEHFCYYFYGHRIALPNEISCQTFYLGLFKLLYNEFGDSEWIGDVKVDRDFNSFIEFTDYYQNELSFDERLPLSYEKFSDNNISFELLMEIINYEPRMDWVPKEILKKAGHNYETMRDGNFTIFFRKKESDVIKAFMEAGYKCVRDDALVSQAYGQ